MGYVPCDLFYDLPFPLLSLKPLWSWLVKPLSFGKCWLGCFGSSSRAGLLGSLVAPSSSSRPALVSQRPSGELCLDVPFFCRRLCWFFENRSMMILSPCLKELKVLLPKATLTVARAPRIVYLCLLAPALDPRTSYCYYYCPLLLLLLFAAITLYGLRSI